MPAKASAPMRYTAGSERTHHFSGRALNDARANLWSPSCSNLNSVDSNRGVDLYIHSPGGSVYAGLAIYDTMKMMSAPVSTYSVGFTGSMGTFLLSSGEKGKRFALPHSTIHMHPTGGGTQGYTEDVRIATREQERLQTQIFHLMVSKPAIAEKRSKRFSCAINS